MDIKQFLAEFKHIILVPDGIKYLREMILSLAFQGNLTQHVNEDASSLLISLEKQRTNASQASYGYQKQTHVWKAEPSFTIPEHWKWLSLSDIGHDWGQKIPSTDFTYIDVSSIDNKKGLLKEQLTVVKSGQRVPSRARKIIRSGTVIYSTVRPYLLNIALVDHEFEHEAIASTAFVVVKTWEGILPKYVYYYLRCPYFTAYVQSVQSGVAYPAISDKKFFSGRIPIPPIAEQESTKK
jgi:type I restriction enzyme S subunit